MIGAIIGTAASIGSALYSGIKSAQAAKKAKRNIEKQKAENAAWYNRRYHEDGTQRADAQRIWRKTQDTIKNRNKQAAATQAVVGGTEESVAATKEANANSLAETASAINALVNLGATTAYAPSAQVPNLAEPWQKRYEEMEKKREANKSFHQKAMQNLQTQEYTVTKALADLGLKDKDFIRKLLETQNRNKNRDTSTANSAKVADARVKNLDSSTELNGHKADLADKQGEATLRNARSNEVKAGAAATNAGNNTRRTNTYVAKGGSGNKEYTETTVTDAVNPITSEQYKKTTTKTRSNGKNIPGFSN